MNRYLTPEQLELAFNVVGCCLIAWTCIVPMILVGIPILTSWIDKQVDKGKS